MELLMAVQMTAEVMPMSESDFSDGSGDGSDGSESDGYTDGSEDSEGDFSGDSGE